MANFAADAACPPERVERISDPEAGLEGVIVIHWLASAGILFAPDFLVNAGGIVSVAGEYFGWKRSEVAQRVDAIPHRLGELFRSAEITGLEPGCVARTTARSIIASGSGVCLLEPAL